MFIQTVSSVENKFVLFLQIQMFSWARFKVDKVAKVELQKRVPFWEICQKLNLFKLYTRSSIFFLVKKSPRWSTLLVENSWLFRKATCQLVKNLGEAPFRFSGCYSPVTLLTQSFHDHNLYLKENFQSVGANPSYISNM